LRDSFGVTHVLRGRLQTQDELIRLNVQLIDTRTLETIWADRLEGSLENIWSLQDQLAAQVTEAVAGELQPHENTKLLQKHSIDVEALAYYRQALLLLIPPNDMTRILTARSLFHRASDLDPNFAGGYAGEGFSHAITVLFLKANDPKEEIEKGIEFARKAIQIDPDFGMGYASLAFALALDGRLEEGLENAVLAISLSPGDAFVQFIYGMNLVLSGRPVEAFEPLTKAIRLNPVEPRTPYLNVLAMAHFADNDYSTTIDMLEKSRQRGGPRGPHLSIFHAAALANLGRETEARHQVAELNQTYPNFPYEAWLKIWIGPTDQLESTLEKLRALGLSQP
jgi:tetratricopeptide (TPR) repeat protein